MYADRGVEIEAGGSNAVILRTNGTTRLIADNIGNVGIGTTTPAYGLVVGDGTTQKDIYIPKGGLCVDNNASGCPTTPSAGTIYASSTAITQIDLAENYPTLDGTIESGDVVALAVTSEQIGLIEKSSQPYHPKLLGAISTAPGVLLGKNLTNSRPVVLAGRAPVKVSTENGEIKIGDLITTSSKSGVAMKATEPGMVLGIALESLSEKDFENCENKNPSETEYCKSKIARIMVFVNPHWSLGSVDNDGIFDQFTSMIKGSLEKLGILIENGVFRIKEIVTSKLSSKLVITNELCLGDTCVNEAQLQELLNLLSNQSLNQNSGGGSDNSNNLPASDAINNNSSGTQNSDLTTISTTTDTISANDTASFFSSADTMATDTAAGIATDSGDSGSASASVDSTAETIGQ